MVGTRSPDALPRVPTTQRPRERIRRGDFVVVFETETPFDSWYFYPGNHVSSTPRSDVEHDHCYKYSVHIDGKRHDPNVIIRP